MTITVRVGGQVLEKWSSMTMNRSITDAAWSVSLQTYNAWEANSLEIPVKLFDEMTVELDGELAFTGHVFNSALSYTDNDHSLTIEGRSLSAALVDCSIPAKTFRGKSLFQIALEILGPFDIAVVTSESEADKKFAKIAIEDGEAIFSFLLRLARYRGLLVTTDEDGDVLLTRAESNPVPGARIESGDGRIMRVDWTQNGQGLYSEYTAKAQIPATGLDSVTSVSISAKVTNPSVPIHRPLVIMPDSNASRSALKKRAEFERNLRTGQSSKLTYLLKGWEAVPGRLWRPNDLIPVRDSVVGIRLDLLIASVTFSLDEGQGQTTELVLQDPTAFLAEKTPIPIEPQKERFGF